MRSRLIANFVGAGWSGCMQIICVPLFIKLMGVEGYGLIGFYLTLQASLQVLDFGLSPTLNRELARYSMQQDKAAEARDFVRTMQTVYWAIGIAIGAGIVLLAPVIATRWIHASDLSTDELTRVIEMMGIVIAIQWPLSLYQGGLVGLQQLILLNGIRIGATTLSYGGAVVVLWLLSQRVEAFFIWQAAVGAAQVSLLGIALWHRLPAGVRPARFDFSLMRGVLRFAGEMSGIALVGILVTQMDKIVLSRFLSLEMFGYYVLAGVVASTLQLFITPIFSVVFPRLSAWVVTGDVEGIRRLYHGGTQLMAVLVLPTAIVLASFAPQFIGLWTGNPKISPQVAPIAILLLMGTAINGLMHLPYALQLAYGWTRIGLQFAVFKLVVFVPLLVWAAAHFGAVGGAAVWALLNITYLVAGIPLTHRRLLQGDATRWAVTDVAYPLLAVWIVVAIARQLLPGDATGWLAAVQLGGVGFSALLAAVLAAPDIRSGLLRGRTQFRFLHP